MNIALAGRSPATFEIKSATLPLVALLLKSTDLAQLATDLAARFGDIPDFFDRDPLVIDLSPVADTDTPIDWPALLALLRSHRMMPVAARGGSAVQMRAAQQAGLAAAPDARLKPPQPARPQPQALAPAEPVEAPAPTPHALLVDKPLRSGQQVYARGRDLVVLSMVNAGAEVIADGSIFVWAPLRGRAIAGARGDADARIVSLGLEPELISIAGVYRLSDVPLPPGLHGQPAQVRLVGGTEGKLVIDRLAA